MSVWVILIVIVMFENVHFMLKYMPIYLLSTRQYFCNMDDSNCGVCGCAVNAEISASGTVGLELRDDQTKVHHGVPLLTCNNIMLLCTVNDTLSCCLRSFQLL